MILCNAISPPDLDEHHWFCQKEENHPLEHDWEMLISDASQRIFPPEVGRWKNSKTPIYEVNSFGNHFRNGLEIKV